MYKSAQQPEAISVSGCELLPAAVGLMRAQADGLVPSEEMQIVEEDRLALLRSFAVYRAAIETDLVWIRPSTFVRKPEILREGLSAVAQDFAADLSLEGIKKFGRQQREKRNQYRLVKGMLAQLPRN